MDWVVEVVPLKEKKKHKIISIIFSVKNYKLVIRDVKI